MLARQQIAQEAEVARDDRAPPVASFTPRAGSRQGDAMIDLERQTITLSFEAYKKLIDAIENPKPPSQALINLMKLTDPLTASTVIGACSSASR